MCAATAHHAAADDPEGDPFALLVRGYGEPLLSFKRKEFYADAFNRIPFFIINEANEPAFSFIFLRQDGNQ